MAQIGRNRDDRGALGGRPGCEHDLGPDVLAAVGLDHDLVQEQVSRLVLVQDLCRNQALSPGQEVLDAEVPQAGQGVLVGH